MEDENELSPAEYLRDLSERIFRIPAMYGVDQGDYDRLRQIAAELDAKKEESHD